MISEFEYVKQEFEKLLKTLDGKREDWKRPGAIVITMLEQAYAFYMTFVYKED